MSIDTAVQSCEVRKLVRAVATAQLELTSMDLLHSVELMLDVWSQSQQVVVTAGVGGSICRSCLAELIERWSWYLCESTIRLASMVVVSMVAAAGIVKEYATSGA